MYTGCPIVNTLFATAVPAYLLVTTVHRHHFVFQQQPSFSTHHRFMQKNRTLGIIRMKTKFFYKNIRESRLIGAGKHRLINRIMKWNCLLNWEEEKRPITTCHCPFSPVPFLSFLFAIKFIKAFVLMPHNKM